jgi:hypothetical protein
MVNTTFIINLTTLMPKPLTTAVDLTTLYVLIDDVLPKPNQRATAGRHSLLSDSELITIIIFNAIILHQKTLKEIWKFVKDYHGKDFPKIPEYAGFVAHLHRVAPAMAELLSLTFAPAKLNFVDSTFLEVCKLHRVDDHKVAKNIAKFGKNHQGWHYGFKMHTAISFFKQLSSVVFTPANVDDAQALPDLVKEYMKLLVGDSIYGASVMRKHIWEKYHILIVAPPHHRQKRKLSTFWQVALLSMRSKIESVFDILKEHLHLVTSFPRSVAGYFVHYLRVLLGYQFSLLLEFLGSKREINF